MAVERDMFYIFVFSSNFAPLGGKSVVCNTNYFNFTEGMPKYKMPSKISGLDFGWLLLGSLLCLAKPVLVSAFTGDFLCEVLGMINAK